MGAIPIFVDADPVSFNLDVQDAARKVTPRTKAIIPVHLFGQCADMDAVMQLAAEHELNVIEDAAQSLGACYKGRSAGSIGTFGTYSFFPSKNLGALGDAGMLVTNDDSLAEKSRLLRSHGAQPKYYHKYIGGNFRLDSLQAAFLRVKLAHYKTYTAKRQANAAYYTEKLGKLPDVVIASDWKRSGTPPSGALRLILPVALDESIHIWNQYTLRVPGSGRRDALRRHLTDHGIGSEIYYPVPMHCQECFASNNAKHTCPIAVQLGNEVISLPVYPELNLDQLEAIVGRVSQF